MAEQNAPRDTEALPPAAIDAREAVRNAKAYLLHLYDQQELPNLRLEEVKRSDDDRHWLITFGFTGTEEEVEHAAFLRSVEGRTIRPRREYKLVKVVASTGEPESMEIREI